MKQRSNTRAAKAAITPEHILARHSPTIRGIAEQLREWIREAEPQAAEVAYPGWHAIGYRHPQRGYFCGIFPFDDCVKLVFEYGVLLYDPFEVLKGEGKQVRHIMYRSRADLDVVAISFLVKQATHMPVQRRKVKRKPRVR